MSNKIYLVCSNQCEHLNKKKKKCDKHDRDLEMDNLDFLKCFACRNQKFYSGA